MVIDLEGAGAGGEFQICHTHNDEEGDTGHGIGETDDEDHDNPGEVKRQKLTDELLAYHEYQNIPF